MKKMIKKSKGKRKAQIKHALRRFDERFDLQLNDNQYKQIVNMIQKGRAEFIRKQSNRITHWDVTFQDQVIRVVYDKARKVVVTALPN